MELRKQNTGSNGTTGQQNNQGQNQNSGNYNPNSSR